MEVNATDVMTRQIVTISPGYSVAHAARLMLEGGVSGLPVVDDDGILVGMITEGDLIRRMEFGQGPPPGLSANESYEIIIKANSWCVKDVMTTPVATLAEDATVEEIASLLLSRKIKRVPIIRAGRLVGMVSRADLLGIIARTTPGTIAKGNDALRLSVLARLGEALPMATLPTVTVERGIVHLNGSTSSAQEHRAIRVIVDNVPGAAGVEDHLRIGRPE
jgi:CBS domain-containing protein